MDYLRSAALKNKFKINEFFKHIEADDKEEADDTFKTLIKKIALLQDDTKENKTLKMFAKKIRKHKFRVLESSRAYKYWNVIALERLTMKKLQLQYIAEENILDESREGLLAERKNASTE